MRRKRRRWDDATYRKYLRHRWRVEGVHGVEKTQHRLRRAVRRGLSNVRIQSYLTAAHVGEGDRWGLLDLTAWRRDWTDQGWRKMLRKQLDEQQGSALGRYTMRGRPLGWDGFVNRIETLLGRRVRALPVGCPKGTHHRDAAGKR